MFRSLSEMCSYRVHCPDGYAGQVQDFLFDDRDWAVRHLVIDLDDGVADGNVLVSPHAVQKADGLEKEMRLNVQRVDLEAGPSVDLDKPVSRQMEERVLRHHGWPIYWIAPHPTFTPASMPPVTPVPGPAIEGEGEAARQRNEDRDLGSEERDRASRDRQDTTRDPQRDPQNTMRDPEDTTRESSHLRSVEEVRGYDIEAIDGSIGEVEDFIAGDASWVIRYLVVNTRKWLPGRHVLIAPQWLRKIDWAERSVYVDLDRERIKKSPPYDPSLPVNHRYEDRLYDFYGRPRAWSGDGTE